MGPFLDPTDGVTPETALTATNCHLTLVVDTGNVPTLVLDASATASGGNNDMVHVASDDAGYYDVELTAANLNYLGRAKFAITDAANHCPVFQEYMIIPAMVYDSMILGTDDLDTNTKKWNDLTTVALPLNPTVAGRALDVSAGGEAGVDWANVGTPSSTVGLSGTTVASLTNAPTAGDLTAAMKASVTTAATAATPSVASVATVGTVTGSVGSVVGLTVANIAAILALLDDPRGEPGQGAPVVNPDLATKIDYLYKFLRNKVVSTATEIDVYADNESTVDHKATTAFDGTTYTRREFVTGA